MFIISAFAAPPPPQIANERVEPALASDSGRRDFVAAYLAQRSGVQPERALSELEFFDMTIQLPNEEEQPLSGVRVVEHFDRPEALGLPTDTDFPVVEPVAAPLPAPFASDRVWDHIDSVSPIEQVSVELSLNRSRWADSPLTFAEQHQVARWLQPSETKRDLKLTWLDDRRRAATPFLDALSAEVQALGGTVTEVDLLSGILSADLPAGTLPTLLESGLVDRVDLASPPQDDGAGWVAPFISTPITGTDLNDLIQSNRFTLSGYDGTGQRIGVVESNAAKVFDSHPGFNGRFENCKRGVFGNQCNPNSPTVGKDHPTAVASIAIGSILNNEDPTISPGVARDDRSGVATGATAMGVTANYQGFMLERLTDPDNEIDLSTHSWSQSNDPTCAGTNSVSRRFNTLFESGQAVFKSAGNTGAPGLTADDPDCALPSSLGVDDCRVGAPGSAIGVFTISGIEFPSNASVRHRCSARGGTSVEGGGRSIIDMATPTRHAFPYPHYDRPTDAQGNPYFYGAEWNTGLGPSDFGATSGATPVAAGAAALFRHWFADNFSSGAMDDPGILYANLLLMGDMFSFTATPSLVTKGYDNLTGAGRLRLRRFDNTMLKAPMAWSTGSRCVLNGQSTTIILAGGALHSDVDVVKATAYFYDLDHDQGGDLSDVDMFLEREAYPGFWLQIKADTSADHKKRVAELAPATGVRYRLRFHGTNISNTGGPCGPNSQNIKWAYFFESSDRIPLVDLYRPEGWTE